MNMEGLETLPETFRKGMKSPSGLQFCGDLIAGTGLFPVPERFEGACSPFMLACRFQRRSGEGGGMNVEGLKTLPERSGKG